MHQARASFASDPAASRGRLHPEAPSATRTPFQRDRDRIIHATAFRRLMHKTQVFISPLADHVRTRLTHSLEVAQIARSMARDLGADEDLTEAIALSHDLGHPPFGHTGEEALQRKMQPFGGFDHNDQALRVLVKLEARYPRFPGLNLTWETLEGVVKHNGPVTGPEGGRAPALPATLDAVSKEVDLRLETHAGIEAQIAAIADDIAYNHHDMDDGLRARLFTIEDVSSVGHAGDAFAAVAGEFPGIERQVLISETVRRLIGAMVTDVLAETRRRIAAAGVVTPEDVRVAAGPMVAFSQGMRQMEQALKRFLFERMYRNAAVEKERRRGAEIVAALFDAFLAHPALLPDDWREGCTGLDTAARARLITDYIAGMTDRYAEAEYARIRQSQPNNEPLQRVSGRPS